MRDLIDATPWVDTHEHLVAEPFRKAPGACRFAVAELELVIPDDWAALLVDYSIHDLRSAGLPSDDAQRVCGDQLSALEKWDLVAPYLDAARSTGYLRAVELSVRRLFDTTLSRSTCEQIGEAMRELKARDGYYAHVLGDGANVERCHVHSLDLDPFEPSADPLIEHDISLFPMVTGSHEALERAAGIEVGSLDDYLAVIEWAFETLGPRAVAAKCNWAYFRPLDVAGVKEPPRAAFERLRGGEGSSSDRRVVEDFLFDRCVEHASRRRLPVKLHLGYLNGNHHPTFEAIAGHVRAATALVQRHPRAEFVLMHIAWPDQDALMALAKQSPNVTVDLCWAWILAPRATRDFVASFLTTVPSNKLLCFGGDYLVVENVVGHAELARRGLQAALELLVADGWLTYDAAADLVPRLMRGNAEALFP